MSSTHVTLTFARTSRIDHTSARALAFGAAATNAMLCPRVLVATAVLNFALLPRVYPYLVAPALVAVCAAAIGFRRTASDECSIPPIPILCS